MTKTKAKIPNSSTQVGIHNSSNSASLQGAYNISTSGTSGVLKINTGSASILQTNNSSTWWSNSYNSYSSYDKYDLESKCLDLEKLQTMNSEMRDMIFNLFLKFMDSTTELQRDILYNTLKPYNVITDKNNLERKVKIGKVLSEKESNDE